ncbi:hypothetical protein B5F29_08870 [Lachnoclostridium sp. An196]|uniref:hypothetical protein n=1 Tax=Lachnoclostridium sp. An196 TaxID=1965583 RepID=UPI000B3819EA|nr:hypothetical protein [Lachnoclostridium sp. An196]OUP19433.1 hypothetical protein B5F29_08870 [Lachnoclostridium sp. An196]
MKLNSEIINDFLSEHMLIRSFGKGTEALRLCRPKIYTGESNEFLPDHRKFIRFSPEESKAAEE